MKAKSLVMTLAACLFLLNLCFSPAALAARVDVIVDNGVEKNAENQARAAIQGIFDFFQRTYGLGLQEDIRIRFSCDKHNYKKALMSEYGMRESQASRNAQSLGMHSQGTLIVDLGEIKDNYFQIFVLCHEIVHFYQEQEGGRNYVSLRWMTEGVANVVAAHNMETVGGQGSGTYKKYWLETLKRARNVPRLENLHSPNEIQVYGGYATASLAVLKLVEWRGYPSLFAYFRNLKNNSPDDAFYKAFGAKLSDFEKGFKPF